MLWRQRKIVLEINDAEWKLIRFGLLQLRDKLVAAQLESDEVNALLARMMR